MTNKKFKRLFFDIETSPNIVFSWNVGRKISIDYDNIVQERAIICICWKWEGEKQVYSLEWKNGDDKEMLKKFSRVLEEADEITGHNGDQFDLKWLRTRCLYHGIPMFPDYQTIDTLKLSRKGFRFNSNRLDYISKFLGIGRKNETGFGLWKAIVSNNDKSAMKKMVDYCKKDVVLLEKVYEKLNPYVAHQVHRAVMIGKSICDCPECTSKRTISNGTRITASGSIKRRLHCMTCGKYFSISDAAYQKNR